MNFQTFSAANADGSEPEYQDKSCEKHGDYKARVFNYLGEDVVMKCPKCWEESKAEHDRREEIKKKQARENEAYMLFRRSGVPLRFADRTLENFNATNPGQVRALRIANRFIETFEDKASPGTSLILSGKPGTGKTHIACGIARELSELLKVVNFMTVAQALRFIKDTYNRDSEKTETQAIRELVSLDLLILDEIGAQNGSEHEKMLMFEIINERYQNCRSTILISNLTGEELSDFLGDRVMDRFRENGAVVAFDWESHRGKREAL